MKIMGLLRADAESEAGAPPSADLRDPVSRALPITCV